MNNKLQERNIFEKYQYLVQATPEPYEDDAWGVWSRSPSVVTSLSLPTTPLTSADQRIYSPPANQLTKPYSTRLQSLDHHDRVSSHLLTPANQHTHCDGSVTPNRCFSLFYQLLTIIGVALLAYAYFL